MIALAALALSLATSTAAPAMNDPGAAPANLAAAPIAIGETPVAMGHAELGAAAQALEGASNLLPGSAAAALAGTHPITIGTPIIGAQTIGTQTIATPMIGIQTISESSRGFPTGSMLPILGFVLCGAAALVFAKKKQQTTPKMLEIVETHGLGGRRSLIVARIAGETVLLGASEAGLTLLLARPGETVGQQMGQPQDVSITSAPRAVSEPPPRAPGPPSVMTNSWLGRLRLARTQEAQEPAPSFEELLARDAAARSQSRASSVEPALLRQPIDPLAESAEDQELRRKLAAGRSGRIA